MFLFQIYERPNKDTTIQHSCKQIYSFECTPKLSGYVVYTIFVYTGGGHLRWAMLCYRIRIDLAGRCGRSPAAIVGGCTYFWHSKTFAASPERARNRTRWICTIWITTKKHNTTAYTICDRHWKIRTQTKPVHNIRTYIHNRPGCSVPNCDLLQNTENASLVATSIRATLHIYSLCSVVGCLAYERLRVLEQTNTVYCTNKQRNTTTHIPTHFGHSGPLVQMELTSVLMDWLFKSIGLVMCSLCIVLTSSPLFCVVALVFLKTVAHTRLSTVSAWDNANIDRKRSGLVCFHWLVFQRDLCYIMCTHSTECCLLWNIRVARVCQI